MRRLAVALTAVAVLVVGSATAAFAQTPPGSQGQQGWGWCHDFGDGYGTYDPSSNPTLKRLADKIGIGAADLAKELQAGKSVAEVAKAKSVDVQSLVDVLLAPQVEMLKLGVKYGYLTQQQADSAQKLMADQTRLQLERKGSLLGFGGMMGGLGGMMGGMMGGYGGMMGPGMMGGGYGGMMGPGFGRGSAPNPRGSSFWGSDFEDFSF